MLHRVKRDRFSYQYFLPAALAVCAGIWIWVNVMPWQVQREEVALEATAC